MDEVTCDLSKYQARNLRPNVGPDRWAPDNWDTSVITLEQLLSASRGLLFRVGDGPNKDPIFDRVLDAVLRLGVPWGVYHYFRPEEDPLRQVDRVAQWCPRRPPMGIWPDLEDDGGLGELALFDRSDAYMRGLDDAYQTTAGVYSGAWFMDPHFSLARQRRWAHRPGWWASYPPGFIGGPRIPVGWQGADVKYWWHQFTDRWTWPGLPNPADANRRNPLVTWEQLLGVPVAQPVPGPPAALASLTPDELLALSAVSASLRQSAERLDGLIGN